MIKHIWTVLCQKSVIDNQSNNLSLIDVFEELKVNYSTPSSVSNSLEVTRINVPISYEIVSLWLRDNYDKDENVEIRAIFIDPTGKELKSFDQSVVMKAKLIRYRTRLRVQGIGLTVPGIYTFEIKIKDNNRDNFRSVASVPLDVKMDKTVAQNVISVPN